jgi:DNA-binding CsgD family transcriptional regulator
MLTSISCALFWALTPLLIMLAVLAWATETQPERIRRWHSGGQSQRAIAQRLGISRHRVRAVLV